MLWKLGVRDPFRPVSVDFAGASAFSYFADDLVLFDWRTQFGWRNSPGYWGLSASALEHSHNHTTFMNEVVPELGRATVVQIRIVADPAVVPVAVPRACARTVGYGR